MKFKLHILLFLALCVGVSRLQAQSDTSTLSGILVIRSPQTLSREIPSLVMDLRYTTPENFLHRRLYPPLATTYMRRSAVGPLREVQAALRPFHLGLKIFDAYRPWSVTVAMWQAVPDDRYAADPSEGSGHNRGIAIDLTLIDERTHQELPMGTGFDSFSDSAHRDYTHLPVQILANRLLLQTLMEQRGFIGLSTEWWHFSLPDPHKYAVLDIPFATLAASH